MSNPDPPSIDPLIRAVRTGLAEARDEQLARIVHVIDGMPDRGRIDDLLPPVRPRLARLRLARPLRFTRVLFIPLQSALADPRAWRPGAPAIPRAALRALAETVRATMGARGEAIERMIAGRTTHDTAAMLDAGQVLWPEAGRILHAAPPPRGWDRTGISLAAYPALARIAGAVLAQTPAVDRMAADAMRGSVPPAPEAIGALLAATRAMDADALALLLVVLLARVPLAVPVLARLSEDGVLRRALDGAQEAVVERLRGGEAIDTQVGRAALPAATDAVRRIATLVHALEEMRPSSTRREKLAAIRQRLDQACQARFDDGLRRDFLAPLGSIGTPARPVAVDALEDVARGLRALETEARAIGGAPAYDRMLALASEAVRATPLSDTLDLSDKARLLEIVADTDAALALYRAGG